MGKKRGTSWLRLANRPLSRRSLLGALCALPAASRATASPGLRRARELVRSGTLGRIVLCRTSAGAAGLAAIHYVLAAPPPCIESTPPKAPAPLAVFLGDRATLALYPHSCRLYPASGPPVIVG
ncbi:MAG: hypothetical protein KGN36_19575 [Acidobacteriota bacterium]|nr:hypothetical protein [Acidobacteriota bacterium]